MLVVPRHSHFIDGDRIAFDTETTGRDPHLGDSPFCYSFANEGGDMCALTWDVDPFTRKPIPKIKALEAIKHLLEDPAITKIGANTKFDMMMSDVNYGIRVQGRIEDVLWKAHVVNSAEMRHALKPLSDKYAGIDNSDEEILGAAVKACRNTVRFKKLGYKIAKKETSEEKDSSFKADYWLPRAMFKHAPREHLDPLLERWPDLFGLNDIYALKDAQRTLILDLFYSQIMDEENLWGPYERELRMLPVTYGMERTGVRVFGERCKEIGDICSARLTELRSRLQKIFGDFNVEVPDNRLRSYLFDPPETGGLGLPVLRRTEKSKQPSVDKETKDIYAESVPVVKDIQDFDRHQKVKAHYVDKYMAHARADAVGQLIIHANIRQIAAITSRMSIADPPLHQIPKRAKAGDIRKKARYPFGPRKGCIWLHNDFKSIEPRVLSEEAEEPDLIRIFGEGGDPYEVLVDRVSEATAIPREALEIMFEERGGARQVCKNNFLGWTYGEGVRKLAAQMGCSEDVAFQIIDALKTAFSGVMPFMAYMQKLAKRQGFIRNRYGRKAMIPPPARVLDENGDWKWVEFWYKATNYLIQGTAAELLKDAMIRLGGEGTFYDRAGIRQTCTAGYLKGTAAQILLPIHDEGIIEMPYKLALNEKFVRGIGEVMADNQGMFKRVATPVDTHVTWDAWSDPEPLETLWS